MTFRQLRQNAKLDSENAAKKLGIKPQTLNKYENAIRSPSLKILLNMIKTYKCTHADVMLAYETNKRKAVEKFGRANP